MDMDDPFADDYWKVPVDRPTDLGGGSRIDFAQLQRVRQQRVANIVIHEQSEQLALNNPALRPDMQHHSYPVTPDTWWKRVRRWIESKL